MGAFVYEAGCCGDMKLAAHTELCNIVRKRLTGRISSPRQSSVTIIAARDEWISGCEALAAGVHLECAGQD